MHFHVTQVQSYNTSANYKEHVHGFKIFICPTFLWYFVMYIINKW